MHLAAFFSITTEAVSQRLVGQQPSLSRRSGCFLLPLLPKLQPMVLKVPQWNREVSEQHYPAQERLIFSWEKSFLWFVKREGVSDSTSTNFLKLVPG